MNRILKAKIVEMHGTQSDFAQAIKTDESLVSRIVRNRRTLSHSDQMKWADALKTHPEKIFNRDD